MFRPVYACCHEPDSPPARYDPPPCIEEWAGGKHQVQVLWRIPPVSAVVPPGFWWTRHSREWFFRESVMDALARTACGSSPCLIYDRTCLWDPGATIPILDDSVDHGVLLGYTTIEDIAHEGRRFCATYTANGTNAIGQGFIAAIFTPRGAWRLLEHLRFWPSRTPHEAVEEVCKLEPKMFQVAPYPIARPSAFLFPSSEATPSSPAPSPSGSSNSTDPSSPPST